MAKQNFQSAAKILPLLGRGERRANSCIKFTSSGPHKLPFHFLLWLNVVEKILLSKCNRKFLGFRLIKIDVLLSFFRLGPPGARSRVIPFQFCIWLYGYDSLYIIQFVFLQKWYGLLNSASKPKNSCSRPQGITNVMSYKKYARTWQWPSGIRPKKVCVTASFTQKGEKTAEAKQRYLAGLYRLMIHLIAVKCRYKMSGCCQLGEKNSCSSKVTIFPGSLPISWDNCLCEHLKWTTIDVFPLRLH